MMGKGAIIEGEVEIEDDVEIGNYCIIKGSEDFPTKIGKGSKIGDLSTIQPGVEVSPKSIIGERVTLGHPSKETQTGINSSDICPILKEFEVGDPRTIIGSGAIIRSGTVIYRSTNIGKNLNTGHNAIIREHLTIGDNCIVGGHTELDGYTIIGNGTIISELIVTCQAMKIGNGVFFGGFLSFSENKYTIPGKITYGPFIDDYVRIGTGSLLMAETKVGKYSMIGANTLVTKQIPERVLAFGSPAKVIRQLTQEEIDEFVNAMNIRINKK